MELIKYIFLKLKDWTLVYIKLNISFYKVKRSLCCMVWTFFHLKPLSAVYNYGFDRRATDL